MSRIPQQLTATERPAVCIRAADRRDHRSIRTLVRAAYGQYAPSVPAPVFRRYLADLLDLDRHAANGELLVAEHDHRVVGYAAYYPDAGRLGFNFPNGWASGRGLAVHPAARGLGVARALIAESERRARAEQAPAFAFHTAGFMGTAIELYDGLGYQRARSTTSTSRCTTGSTGSTRSRSSPTDASSCPGRPRHLPGSFRS